MKTSIEVLKETFGYDKFREGQEEIISSMLSGVDSLGIMPTGSGKSLCYQLPALVKGGVTIVISPLVSLMQDQVRQLLSLGIKGAYINSSLTPRQIDLALNNISRNHYKIIYVAPERLMSANFLRATENLTVDFIIVDEAHCISKWGHDFRTSYRDIPAFVNSFKQRPTLAGFTATANARTKEDIIRNLELHDPLVVKNSFDRPNIYFDILPSTGRRNNLLDAVSQELESSIIYCNTRKETERVNDFLNKNGVSSVIYHAGLTTTERRTNQDDFIFDKVRVIVATNAFGMGINKPDVRNVIHYNIPKDIESYYQEVGRAGRDGLPARGLLFYSQADVFMNQRILSYNQEQEKGNPQQMHRFQSLERMNAYAVSTSCLRNIVLSYFGEHNELACGNCINCKTSFNREDITYEALTILDYVKDLNEVEFALGKVRIVKVLVDDEQSEDPIQSPLSGKLNNRSAASVKTIIDYLVDHRYLIIDSLNYYVIRLGDKSLAKNETLEMKTRKIKNKQRRRKTSKTQSEKPNFNKGNKDEALYDALRNLRTNLAAQAKMPPYVIFDNVTLNELTEKKPRTKMELLSIYGIGDVKLKRYGAAIFEVIEEFTENK